MKPGAASEPVAAAAVPTIKFANKPGGNPGQYLIISMFIYCMSKK